MPYWAGASPSTIDRFKWFYAYCQWMATLGCLANGNPLWPLCIALPIQLASLLMTLVRKGLLTARGYHLLYTASACRSSSVSGPASRPFVDGVRADPISNAGAGAALSQRVRPRPYARLFAGGASAARRSGSVVGYVLSAGWRGTTRVGPSCGVWHPRHAPAEGMKGLGP